MTADGKGGAIVNLASIASLLGLADRFACTPHAPVLQLMLLRARLRAASAGHAAHLAHALVAQRLTE